jgi:hypothetical protein
MMASAIEVSGPYFGRCFYDRRVGNRPNEQTQGAPAVGRIRRRTSVYPVARVWSALVSSVDEDNCE